MEEPHLGLGDPAQRLGVDPDELEENPHKHDLPDSVIGFLRGELGKPPGGWPEPFRSKVLEDRGSEAEEPTISEEDRVALEEIGGDRRGALDRLMMPGPARDHAAAEERYGDVSVIPTRAFLYGLETGEELAVDLEPGVRLYLQLEAVTGADDRGMRALILTLNGQPRNIDAQDRSLRPETPRREKADTGDLAQVAASMTGVVSLSVEDGQEVEEGHQVGTIEAMKMESAISAPLTGTVARVAISSGTNVEPGDLLMVLTPK